MARYRSVRVASDHPLARINASLSSGGSTVAIWEHRLVLWEKIGPGVHRCHWCDREVHWNPAEGQRPLCADHLDDDVRNNDPSNLVPSCRGCNAHRSRRVQDGETYVVRGGKRLRATVRTCCTCGDSFLIATTQLRNPRYGQYCSRSCRARAQRQR